MTTHTRVAVVGLGALGAAALWRLAARGVDVVGFEQFGIGHALGSSHGQTRLFREACLEHPGLAPMAAESRTLFRQLEQASGKELLRITGGYLIGSPESDVVAGTARAADAYGLPYERLDRAALAARLPQQAELPPDACGIHDPGCGVIDPEATVVAAVAEAARLGAAVHTHTTVETLEPGADGVRITAGGRVHTADAVIVAAGAWLPPFIPELELTPVRTPLHWFAPDRDGAGSATDFAVDRFPVIVRQTDPETVLWGHGAVDGGLVKLGIGDIWGERPPRIDPSALDRGVNTAEWRRLSALVERVLPGLDPVPARVEPCMITLSPDDQFVIGTSPASPRILVAGGDSGHAFKHCLAIGESLARDVAGEAQPYDLDFVRPGRFAV
ncbi:N-methyl-L-tryptophan oxidase [Arthrobacter sp. JSM 101049]|uniref:N-methyl-L-tryptophan oxidase n=1 Tax=Arthrobacter sp. JSM 101049 TaxID=929097 RepID=UPI00356513A7